MGARKKVEYKVGDHINIGKFHGEILDEYIGDNDKHYFWKYKCDVCGYIGENRRDHICNGIGCKCCANRVVVPGINDIPTTHPEFVKYFPGGYEEAVKYHAKSTEKIVPICPYCGKSYGKGIHIRNIIIANGIQCVCNDGVSTPNKFIFALMEQLKELGQVSHFQREYQLEEDKRRFYDIYFTTPSGERCLVEMDGGFHPRYYGASDSSGKERYLADLYKNSLARKSGYSLIRIKSDESDLEYLKENTLNSRLSKIVDLKDVDWKYVFSQSIKNLAKEVCDYRKAHPDYFPKQIASVFDIAECTVVEYLKKGNAIGWCVYDPVSERNRYYEIGNKKWVPVKVEIIDTGEVLSFASANAAKRALNKIGYPFTTKIIRENINSCGYLLNYHGLNIYKGDK